MKKQAHFFISILMLLFATRSFAATLQWTPAQANAWYAQQGWMVGANFIPADAINQLEMWQQETFDPTEIDRELGFAEQTGMTTMRVFLHDLVWQNDQQGFIRRINAFLAIASRHHIKPLFVIFDSCWNAHPKWGKQPAPTPFVHNSGWVQSPGTDALMDPTQVPRLRAYVQGLIGTFANDNRIVGWDLWNEPDNINSGADSNSKVDAVAALLPQVFAWARSANPTQPLTSGVWTGDDWSNHANLNSIEQTQLGLSDIITFHNYDPAPQFEARVQSLLPLGRPIICTEYMARPLGSTIQTILPLAKTYNVSAINWGFVSGKTQTIYPWDSWTHQYSAPPQIWFHDLYNPNGTPFATSEISLIQALTRPVGQ